MRVGIVTKWFNRGQPIVGRYIRSAVDELGHESFVLARPRREQGPRPGALERTGIWDQPGVTEGSAFEVPAGEYAAWVADNAIDVVLCDQNYQFEELRQLRDRGVRVIGRFVWEHFTEDHLAPAREAYDVIYSVTECEQRRYAGWGLQTPRVPWGIHPELLEVPVERVDDGITRFVFPGGFIGHRKPLEPVVEAFARAEGDDIRLLVKAQVERDRLGKLPRRVRKDERIEFRLADDEWDEHLRILASCDVCLTPSRWEGLGLPPYEATAFGQPVITNDDPPMNEVVLDGVNGILVPSHPDGTARSGIAAKRPDPDALTDAIERLADPKLGAELAAGARRRAEELSWSRTVAALGELLGDR
ncbi:MAG TPA: glycosyltransferase family 4 protein [Solirubrobacterales bacterium]|nr:glycosyltransferase family 4 protein [Solirubrobacterales bacterium]